MNRMTLKPGLHRPAILLLLAAVASLMLTSSSEPLPIYLNTSYSFEERAADLVSRLTLEEKQSLLGNSMAAVPRLGIKSYNVWSEALHGLLSGANPSVGLLGPTSFPNSVALGSSWDPSLVERMASAIADEARATFQTGTKGLTFWSPVVEPVRDPRWGRTGESYGEDPFLVGEMAGGFVRGMTGVSPYGVSGSIGKYLKAVPTAKHYFANNSEFDRHVSSSDMDSRDMREFYLYPYKELIEKDNLPSIMSSYNAVNGVPTSASAFYLDTLARRTYGMKGYITGDCSAIDDIMTGHFYAKSYEEAAAMGIKAGVDSDCGSIYQRYAISAYNKGLISMGDIDRVLVNMFTIRMRTGEFDPEQMVPYTKYPASMVSSPANRALAAEIAARTPVLLKDVAEALPLNAGSLKSIALIGPQANDVELGPYSGRPEDSAKITPYDAIRSYLKNHGSQAEVKLVNGGNIKSKSNLLYVAYFEIEKTDGKTTRYDATKYTGSSKGITVGSGMGNEDQVRTIDDGSWTSYSNVDVTNIQNITVGLNIPTVGGIVEVRVGGPDGNLIGRITATAASGARVGGVYGTSMPMKTAALKLGFNGPQTLYLVYKAPQDAPIDNETIETAKSADVAVVFVGTDENTATEEADRLTLKLPGNQLDLIKAVAAVNPHTIVVMQTLGCVEVEEFKNLPSIQGIVWTGYNGQAQGDGIARVLFGDVNPGGKLNATWYKSLSDLPAITDYTLRGQKGGNGRTLWYFGKDVSYEFGYGLSYTTFKYSNFRISAASAAGSVGTASGSAVNAPAGAASGSVKVTPSDKITVSVDVTNTGKCDGDEVVQVYMTTPDSPASLQRPIKRLKGFSRVSIARGQTRTVNIDIDCADLWFWDMASNRMTYDQGRYVFEIGSSSKDIRGTITAVMSGKAAPRLKTVVAQAPVTVFKAGETAKASVTACLTDDSFIDIAKAQLSWSSNNSSVASVSASGVVSAVSTGVATITCSVTYAGSTASSSFPVKVMPNLALSSLKVAGKPVKLGSDTQFSYIRKATAPAAASAASTAASSAASAAASPAVSAAAPSASAPAGVPTVTALAADPAVSVSVSQAQAVPGTATVEVSDALTCDSRIYSVNFGVKSVSDEFKSATLGPQWSFVREDKSLWSLTSTPGSLVLTAGKGDIALKSNNAANVLLQSANTDWTIDTRMTCSATPAMPAQNAGMLAYQDDDNFVKYVYAATFGFRRPDSSQPAAGQLQLMVEENGNQKSSVSFSLAGIIGSDNVIYLRLVKSGTIYTAYWSVDGKKYTLLGTAEASLKNIKAGLMACEGEMPAMMRGFGGPRGMFQMPAASTLKAAFDFFKIQNVGLK